MASNNHEHESASAGTQKNKRQQMVTEDRSQLALTRTNFIMMACCGFLIVLGFALMSGGSTTTSEFNPDIFSTRRIVVGPAISFIGFALMAFAILYRKPQEK